MIKNREDIEWSNFWWEDANRECSRILLIGDSVTRGYRSLLNNILKNTDYVIDLCAFSASITDDLTDKMLAGFFSVSEYSYECIGIQLGGQHGFKNLQCHINKKDRETFKELYQKYVRKLRSRCGNIFFISYTPTVLDENLQIYNINRNNELICRNEIVREVALETHSLYIDLWSMLLDRKCEHIDKIHFDRKTNLYIAAKVARELISKMYIKMDAYEIIKSNYQRMILDECFPDNSELVYQSLVKEYGDFKQGVILFGAGTWGKEMYRVLANRQFPVFVVDNNRKKWGQSFFETEISSPCICKDFEGYIIVTVLNAQDEIEKQIKREFHSNARVIKIEAIQKMVQAIYTFD